MTDISAQLEVIRTNPYGEPVKTAVRDALSILAESRGGDIIEELPHGVVNDSRDGLYGVYESGAGSILKPKNVLVLPDTKTVNGVTYTVDKEAGTVTANGYATSESKFEFYVPSGVIGYFYMTGCPSGGGFSNYNIFMWDVTSDWHPDKWDSRQEAVPGTDTGNMMIETKIETGHRVLFVLRVYGGYTANNLVFIPALLEPIYQETG